MSNRKYYKVMLSAIDPDKTISSIENMKKNNNR